MPVPTSIRQQPVTTALHRAGPLTTSTLPPGPIWRTQSPPFRASSVASMTPNHTSRHAHVDQLGGRKGSLEWRPFPPSGSAALKLGNINTVRPSGGTTSGPVCITTAHTTKVQRDRKTYVADSARRPSAGPEIHASGAHIVTLLCRLCPGRFYACPAEALSDRWQMPSQHLHATTNLRLVVNLCHVAAVGRRLCRTVSAESVLLHVGQCQSSTAGKFPSFCTE